MEPLFTALMRLNQMYTDKEFVRFSLKRIDETWLTWEEGISTSYPGYFLDENLTISNKSDILIDLDEIITLFRSKDISKYQQVKNHFFGHQARYTTQNAEEQMSVMYATYPRSGNSLMRK